MVNGPDERHDPGMTTEPPDAAASSAARPTPRPLRRRATDRVLGGVASGIADYFNVDPILVRALFVGLLVFGGSGLFLYFGAWLLIPVEGSNESMVEAGLRRVGVTSARGIAILVLAIAVLYLLFAPAQGPAGITSIHLEGGVFLVFVGLVALGLLLLRGSGTSDPPAASPSQPSSSSIWPTVGALAVGALVVIAALFATGVVFGFGYVDAPVWIVIAAGAIGLAVLLLRRNGSSATEAVIAPAPAADAVVEPSAGVAAAVAGQPTYVRVARPRVPRGPLGWYTVAAVLVCIGLLALFDTLTDATVLPGQYFGIVLAIVGIGLVAGAWWGNARLLILPALLILPIALAASYVRVPLEGGTGSHQFTPVRADEVRDAYRLAAGALYLDLRELETSGEPITITASVAVGEVWLLVPANADVEIAAEVGAGNMYLLGNSRSGTDLDERIVRGSGEPDFILDLAAGIGAVTVHQEK